MVAPLFLCGVVPGFGDAGQGMQLWGTLALVAYVLLLLLHQQLPLLLCLQAQAREAAMQVQAAVLTAQNVHLRRELGSGWAAADPNIIQVRGLTALWCVATACCAQRMPCAHAARPSTIG
jgi:hypothetical protein